MPTVNTKFICPSVFITSQSNSKHFVNTNTQNMLINYNNNNDNKPSVQSELSRILLRHRLVTFAVHSRHVQGTWHVASAWYAQSTWYIATYCIHSTWNVTTCLHRIHSIVWYIYGTWYTYYIHSARYVARYGIHMVRNTQLRTVHT